MTKTIRLGETFTQKEFEEALILLTILGGRQLHNQLRDKIVIPAMDRINEKTGQENNADYWAYLLEYHLMEIK